MISSVRFSVLFATIFFATSLLAQTQNSIVEYLSVPGPITFNKAVYDLSWSSHPSATYYKQEYLVKRDNPDRFKTMLMLEVLTGPVKVASVVADKVKELKAMKASNPFVTYQLVTAEKPGEQILDFLMTQNSPDGKSVIIAEHNVYHYVPFTDASGQKGIQLFAISERAYDANSKAFINSLKTSKAALITKMKIFPVPVVAIKK